MATSRAASKATMRTTSKAASKAASRTEGSRRTRANPSPGGFRELPQPTRRSKQPNKKREVTSASLPAPEESQDAAAFSTTSRSRSPDTHSESPQPQVPESRSTSPPNQQLVRTTPTSHTPTEGQQYKPRRSNNGASGSKKRLRDNDKNSEQRPAKRARATSRTTEEQAQYYSDSSLDAETPQSFALPATPYVNDSSEDEVGEERSNQGLLISPIQQRRFLSPKSKRPKPTKHVGQTASETQKINVPLSMEDRQRIYFEKYGKKMPEYNPHLNSTLRRKGASPSADSTKAVEDESKEDLGEDYMDGPSFTEMSLRNWATPYQSSGMFQMPSKSADIPQTKRKVATPASSSRPSTTIPTFKSKPSQIIIPATRSEPEHSLTRPDLIDAVLSLIKWAEDDNTRVVPTPQQMEALLDSFNAQEQAKTRQSPRSQQVTTAASSPPTIHQERILNQEPYDPGSDLSDREGASRGGVDVEVPEDRSEVPNETHKPQTPRPVARPQESRSIWTGISAVKSLISTPLKYFRGQSQSADATNNTPESSEFTFRHSHNLPAAPEIMATPSRPTDRRAGAQTERRGRHQPSHGRVAQSERRPRHVDPQKPPMHLRGIATPARIAEIHREQDRKKQREAKNARVEDLDTDLQIPQSAHAGNKRKRPQRAIRPPVEIPSSTFRVPDSSSSDDDTDDEEEERVQKDSPNSNRNIVWPVHDRRTTEITLEILREQYAFKYRIPMHQVPDDDYLLDTFAHAEGRTWPNEDHNIRFQGERQYEAEKVAAKKAGLPLYPGVHTPKELYEHDYYDTSYQKTDRPVSVAKFGPPKSSSVHGDMNNGRVPPYTGSIARQPPAVQANIDEGLYPTAPRSTPTSQKPGDNLFAANPDNLREPLFQQSTRKAFSQQSKSASNYDPYHPLKNKNITETDPFKRKSSIKRWCEENPDKVHKFVPPSVPKNSSISSSIFGKSPSKSTADRPISSGTYELDYENQDEDKDDADDDRAVDVVKKNPPALHASSSGSLSSSGSRVASSASVSEIQKPNSSTPSSPESADLDESNRLLTSKKWEQTPPPKPRPSNAQLPHQQVEQALDDPSKPQTPQEQAQRAKALKFAPVKPSGLRNMTQMSPMQAELGKENKIEVEIAVNGLLFDNTRYFTKEVNEALAAISDGDIIPMALPAYLYKEWPSQTEAENAAGSFFT